MTEPKTKIQHAIDYIAAHPGCRTPELAKALDCEIKNVLPCLQDGIKAGLIITCKVERPGQVAISEFRLSASAPEGKSPDWKTFRINRNQPDALKPPPAKPARAHDHPANEFKASIPARQSATPQPAVGLITPAVVDCSTSLATSSGKATTVIEPPKQDEAPAEACSDEILIAIDSRGVLTVSNAESMIELDRAATRQLGQFLINTEPAWA